MFIGLLKDGPSFHNCSFYQLQSIDFNNLSLNHKTCHWRTRCSYLRVFAFLTENTMEAGGTGWAEEQE
jgi:hypothetical protein